MTDQQVPRERGLSLGGALLLIGGVVGTAALIVVATYLLRPAPQGAADEGAHPAATCETGPEAHPAPVTSGALNTCPATFDGAWVRFEGEAIGELLQRDAGTWVLVNDDAYASSGPLATHGRTLGTNSGAAVLLPEGAAAGIDALGGPGVQGDRIAVEGRFELAAAADGGGPAILAESVDVLAEGGAVTGPPAVAQRIAAVVLVVLAGAALALLRARRP